MAYNLLINGAIPWGYNLLTNLLLTNFQRDIQVGQGLPGHRGWKLITILVLEILAPKKKEGMPEQKKLL